VPSGNLSVNVVGCLLGISRQAVDSACIRRPLGQAAEGLEQIPFASERERAKMLAKTKCWSRFRKQTRAEAALAACRT